MTARHSNGKRNKRKAPAVKVDIIKSTFPQLPDITAKPNAERERSAVAGLRVNKDAVDFWVSYFNLHAAVPLYMTGARFVHTDGKGKHVQDPDEQPSRDAGPNRIGLSDSL